MSLDKSAFQTYRLLPASVKPTYSATVDALKERFCPVDIEELRGMEFHQMTQKSGQTVEQMGIELQKLAQKAFPTITGKDLDRLLKGRFFQALMPVWQHKPKTEETFNDLLNRARTLECRERQYSRTAENRTPQKPSEQRVDVTRPSADAAPKCNDVRPSIQCDACHIASQCRSTRNRSEAAGRSRENSSRMLATTASLTDDELKEELARRQLQKEQQLLTDTSEVQAVTGEAVGPALSMDVNVEGVVVPAVGLKSTVISRSLLHRIKRHLLS